MSCLPLLRRYSSLFLILLFTIYSAFQLLKSWDTKLLFSDNDQDSSGKINIPYKLRKKTLRSCANFCDLIKPLSLVKRSPKIMNSTGRYIYLTFDDAPVEGTAEVLDALKQLQVKATFFIVGFKLHQLNTSFAWSPREFKNRNASDLLKHKDVIVRMIKEGHLLADHSYDHMWHNHKGTKIGMAYAGVNDIHWFGEKSINAVLTVMRDVDLEEEKVINVTSSMWNYVRLPYTNSWRLGAIESGRGKGSTGRLSDALRNDGALVFGWDISWGTNWNGIFRFKYGGQQMFDRLSSNLKTKTKGKTVLLSHDQPHRPGGDVDGKEELIKFITLAKRNGYKFRTVDTYLTD